MPDLRLRLLGAFALETELSGEPVRLGRKGQAALAYVAMHPIAGSVRDRLIALLWADQVEHDARSALRQCLHLVRRALDPASAEALSNAGDRILLRPGAWDIDVSRFEALAARSDVESMLAAAELYRGDFLEALEAGEDFSRWAQGERERLRDLAHGLVTRLSECASGVVAHDTAVRLARRLLATDPVHEGCYRALMRLHSQAGLRAKALQTWHECQQVLRRELDVAPSAQTAAVVEQLRCESIAPSAPFQLKVVGSGPAILASAPLSPAATGEDPIVLDLLLRGWQFFSLMTAQDNAKARAAFEGALRHAGANAEAIARLGWTHWIDSLSGWTASPALSFKYASHCAMRAIACNRGGQPSPHSIHGKVLLWRMQHEAAIEQLQHAVALGPNSAYPHFHLGDASVWYGRGEEALAHISRALELDQNDHGMFLTIRGMALWTMGERRDAETALRSAINRNPTYPWPHSIMVAVHVENGDIEAARATATTARRLNRRFSLSFVERVMPFRVPEHRRRMLEAWRAVGMPQYEARGGLPMARQPHPAAMAVVD